MLMYELDKNVNRDKMRNQKGKTSVNETGSCRWISNNKNSHFCPFLKKIAIINASNISEFRVYIMLNRTSKRLANNIGVLCLKPTRKFSYHF